MTSPGTVPTLNSETASARGVRYRASCDYCQKTKVRCSQGKPACIKCINKAIPCVYSPARRMGRLRKTDHQLTSSRDRHVDHEDEAGLNADVEASHIEDVDDSRTSSGYYISTGPTSVTLPSNTGPPTTGLATQVQPVETSNNVTDSLRGFGQPSSIYPETP